ncbi:MAG: NAD-dependent epimerase/dehydratase family protein [Methanomicrobiales archaeon]|jgi:UDP-glucose 4-epimerase|nr:NAD-dependent epimerase/dehydratase family protein [Methanomicrobiales archaeon]
MFSVVTGGAGFIGSHIVDALVQKGEDVLVIDNMKTGSVGNIQQHLREGRARLIQADLTMDGWQDACEGASRIYHVAADPDVRESAILPEAQISNNVLATARVLDTMRRFDIPSIVFTSTSTVYGEARVIPTPEDYSPMEPISVYGATKLAAEALISAYCHSFGLTACVFRFANIIGERATHGVCWDFIEKLRKNPHALEILGDGRQIKSYLEVHACVEAILFAAEKSGKGYNVFNIGSEDWIDVRSIADIVVEEMGLDGVEYRFTGGERGWVGDVPRMLLSIEKIRSLGWRPSVGSGESVRMAVKALLGK